MTIEPTATHEEPFSTADLCDRWGDAVHVCSAPLRSFGARRTTYGPIACVRVFEDATLVRTVLGERGEGRVLVVDGGGSCRVALLGEKLAKLGLENGWAGVVINGAVRDVEMLGDIDFAVFALGSVPRRGDSVGGNAERAVPLEFGGVRFEPGNFVCADSDGVVLRRKP